VLPIGLDQLTGTLDVLQPKSQTTQGIDHIYSITFFGGGTSVPTLFLFVISAANVTALTSTMRFLPRQLRGALCR